MASVTAKVKDSIKTEVTILENMRKISLQAKVDTNGKTEKVTKEVGFKVFSTEKESKSYLMAQYLTECGKKVFLRGSEFASIQTEVVSTGIGSKDNLMA